MAVCSGLMSNPFNTTTFGSATDLLWLAQNQNALNTLARQQQPLAAFGTPNMYGAMPQQVAAAQPFVAVPMLNYTPGYTLHLPQQAALGAQMAASSQMLSSINQLSALLQESALVAAAAGPAAAAVTQATVVPSTSRHDSAQQQQQQQQQHAAAATGEEQPPLVWPASSVAPPAAAAAAAADSASMELQRTASLSSASAAGEKKRSAAFIEEARCAHNAWDNVRTKGGVTTLRCRKCQSQLKGSMEVVGDKTCTAFAQHECRSAACTLLHVYRQKMTLMERRALFGEAVVVPNLISKKELKKRATLAKGVAGGGCSDGSSDDA